MKASSEKRGWYFLYNAVLADLMIRSRTKTRSLLLLGGGVSVVLIVWFVLSPGAAMQSPAENYSQAA